MTKKTLIEKWKEEGLAPQLKELMNSPIFKRAMEIVEEHTQPHDLVIQRAYRESPQHADAIIASIHKMQAGERRVIRMLRYLSEAAAANSGNLPPPFDHVDETYFETR